MLGLVRDQLRSEDSMAHFAELNNVNVVTRVLVVHNNELLENGVEVEAKGVAFLQSLFGAGTFWKQTSYNANFRGKYAGIGFVYATDIDEFLTPEEAAELGLPVAFVVESAPVTTSVEESVPVVEALQEIISQAQVDLTSTALPAFTSSDVAALSSEQITGL